MGGETELARSVLLGLPANAEGGIALRNTRFIFLTRRHPVVATTTVLQRSFCTARPPWNDRTPKGTARERRSVLPRADNATDDRIKALNQAEGERWLRLAEVAEKQDQK